MNDSDEELAQILLSICEGFAEGDKIKIKHLSFAEETKIKKYYKKGFDLGLSQHLKPESEIIDEEINSGRWSLSREVYLKNLKKQINEVEESKRKIKTFDVIDDIYENLQNLKSKLYKELEDRRNLLKDSAETFANNYYNFYHICNSVYLWDGDWRLVTEDYLDYCDSDEYYTVQNFFYKKLADLSIENIKKICINSFFYNGFHLSDKTFDYFLKPIYKLTNAQITLLRFAQTFSKIIVEINDLPEDYSNIPDKILMYWYAIQNGAREKESKRDSTESKLKEMFNKVRAEGM